MKRPKKTTVQIAANGMMRVGSLLAILSLAGFITLPDAKPAILTHSGPDKDVVNIDGLMKKVLELNNQKHHQEAIDLLMAALESKKDDQLIRVLLLQTFDMFLQDEVRQGESAVKKDPRDTGAYNRVATALELMGDDFRAMEVLLTGINQSQGSTALWMKVGKLELKASRPMEALDIFKEVVRLDPKNSDAYNNVAFILSQAQNCNGKDLNLAENYAENARLLDPKNPEYIDTLAEVQFRLGNLQLAQSLILEAIKIAPEKLPFEKKLKKFSADQSIPEQQVDSHRP